MQNLTFTFVHAPVSHRDQYDVALFSPLWAYTLAAHVPAPWAVRVVDCLLEDPGGIGASTVFAFSGTNDDLESIRAVHRLLQGKYPDATFVLGGPITWSLQQEGKLGLVDFFDRIFVLDGERTLPVFLRNLERGTADCLPKVIQGERFSLDEALSVPFDLCLPHVAKYYGASIEVSRGCPFLCEFCDVRVLPDNNRANNKRVDLITGELDRYFAAGITQFLFVCDNFIGDVGWARECVDAILAWQKRTGGRISIFTWATINLCKLPDLMAKMRAAGFSVLYVGIESVNQNALLETAKVQNRLALQPAITTIQSFGFVVVPGFIFGFDSDGPNVFESTLAFLVETGLIGGDPSFLAAMPGTPLFERMKRTGRLVDRDASATSRTKIATNIRYLMEATVLARGFVRFVEELTSAETQWERFRRHVDGLIASKRFVAPAGSAKTRGLRGPLRFLALQLARRDGRRMLLERAAYLFCDPARTLCLLRGWRLVRNASRSGRDLEMHFYLWAYAWSSVGLRYRGLRESDLALHSVPDDFDLSQILEPNGDPADVAADRLMRRDRSKEALQARHTRSALRKLVATRSSRDSAAAAEGPLVHEHATIDGR